MRSRCFAPQSATRPSNPHRQLGHQWANHRNTFRRNTPASPPVALWISRAFSPSALKHVEISKWASAHAAYGLTFTTNFSLGGTRCADPSRTTVPIAWRSTAQLCTWGSRGGPKHRRRPKEFAQTGPTERFGPSCSALDTSSPSHRTASADDGLAPDLEH